MDKIVKRDSISMLQVSATEGLLNEEKSFDEGWTSYSSDGGDENEYFAVLG